ncbi:MAG: discoidin domain-containing protein [Verrucomicrobia bacterium]|nr:discoidin domain-containing protein [Verrucomicrobiota bacterium]
MNIRCRKAIETGIFLSASVLAGVVRAEPVAVNLTPQIESEWLAEYESPSRKPTVETDAAGGCDGVKDGTWGFHTADSDNPWWQVDLGAPTDIDRIVIWNRGGEVAARAYGLRVLVSGDNKEWKEVYANGGKPFGGVGAAPPLDARIAPVAARFVRITLPGRTYLHFDEVEIFGPRTPSENLALAKPATQSGVSQWSKSHVRPLGQAGREALLTNRREQRRKLLGDPLLDFDTILFTKRVPGSFNHMSDQYYGWWSRPGGGIYLLRGFKTGNPTTECLTGSFREPGSFLRPMLSWDAKKVIFAWCRHYPDLAAQRDKMNKANVPEDAFYHVFEMNIDGSGVKQLTRGKYDDFDARYLPDGRMVFMSTRRGVSTQAGRASAARTMENPALPDCYVRCGGDPSRPVAVYTLHTMAADGSDITAISPFEMFEWEPSVADDGTILYSRWDYIDRDNMPYMSLWSTHPDGTNTRLVFGNHTRNPHCVFEPRSIPGSNKIIFTASGHHSQTMGSLVLLDPSHGYEGDSPITRLTPEVRFPEIEGWPDEFYANPWPLSEQLHLVAWGREASASQGQLRPANSMGIYLFDAKSGRELLYRDPEISCMYPIPVKPRPIPPVLASPVAANTPRMGRFMVLDVNQGLTRTKSGEIRSLRIIAVPPKTHPVMNHPSLGITRDEPGKCVLGTVPVESDGSAHFVVPSGVVLFFQALDAKGRAVQTMRSATYLQPGESQSCIGCHEGRHTTPPPANLSKAAVRAPSRIKPGPSGSWPYRYDQLVQPVLDHACAECHGAGGKPDLNAGKSYASLIDFGKPSLREQVMDGYRRGSSEEGTELAANSTLIKWLERPASPCAAKLTADSWARLSLWLDLYGQFAGSYSGDQEQELERMKSEWAEMLEKDHPAK